MPQCYWASTDTEAWSAYLSSCQRQTNWRDYKVVTLLSVTQECWGSFTCLSIERWIQGSQWLHIITSLIDKQHNGGTATKALLQKKIKSTSGRGSYLDSEIFHSNAAIGVRPNLSRTVRTFSSFKSRMEKTKLTQSISIISTVAAVLPVWRRCGVKWNTV